QMKEARDWGRGLLSNQRLLSESIAGGDQLDRPLGGADRDRARCRGIDRANFFRDLLRIVRTNRRGNRGDRGGWRNHRRAAALRRGSRAAATVTLVALVAAAADLLFALVAEALDLVTDLFTALFRLGADIAATAARLAAAIALHSLVAT